MGRRTIDVNVKAAILAEAQVEGADLKALALKHGVSLPTVYNYLKAARPVEVVAETPVV